MIFNVQLLRSSLKNKTKKITLVSYLSKIGECKWHHLLSKLFPFSLSIIQSFLTNVHVQYANLTCRLQWAQQRPSHWTIQEYTGIITSHITPIVRASLENVQQQQGCRCVWVPRVFPNYCGHDLRLYSCSSLKGNRGNIEVKELPSCSIPSSACRQLVNEINIIQPQLLTGCKKRSVQQNSWKKTILKIILLSFKKIYLCSVEYSSSNLNVPNSLYTDIAFFSL